MFDVVYFVEFGFNGCFYWRIPEVRMVLIVEGVVDFGVHFFRLPGIISFDLG